MDRYLLGDTDGSRVSNEPFRRCGRHRSGAPVCPSDTLHHHRSDLHFGRAVDQAPVTVCEHYKGIVIGDFIAISTSAEPSSPSFNGFAPQ
jgi:hypothetical protein